MTRWSPKSVSGILLLLVGISVMPIFCPAETSPKAVTIGFLPGGDPEDLKKGSVEIAKALQDELQIPVNVFLSKDYVGLIDAMKNKKVDFAFLTSMTYVFAEKSAGAKVLLKRVWFEDFYHSVILALNSSKISKLSDLKGKRLAFVDEKSTSGYLYPQVLFKKKGLAVSTLKEIKFSGSHSQSVDWLDQGVVDAIAVFADDTQGKKNAYTKYSKKDHPEKNVRILWTSAPIPNDPFCVRQDFYDQYPKTTHQLMFALIDVVDKMKNNKYVEEAVGSKGLMPATQRQYDPVREMVKELDLKM
ncbi:MAG: phosphate/phosphite/phosphonate ABC transporter substrate-binding protein [Bdellovibrio sp. CG10_big_fil_rev_8_21_14_0_10_47_8]|nr:MAG: phosphate/phosphite/phosphonate ABC transporter substrate-binding protein [Bdellovibrio sp. CG10_big_fil_rev_8_21_14_0_10_47_8]